MTSAIEILWKQALKTFDGRRNVGFKLCQQNFDKLWNLMNKITAEDVNLNKQVLDFVQEQPMHGCVINIFENKDVTISIFILKPGVTMPMHDHPEMHGFLKVISGAVQVNSYSLKTNDDQIIIKKRLKKEIAAVKHRPVLLHSNSPACILTPWDKNLHEITCIDGPGAFLDILSPPYDVNDKGRGPRPCTYFKTVSSKVCSDSPDVIEDVKLAFIDGPLNFSSLTLRYTGPPLISC